MCDVKEGQISPIPDVFPVWEHDWSDYPDMIRVAMADGNVVNYRIDVELPHPAFKRVMKLLEKIPYGPSDKGYRHKK